MFIIIAESSLNELTLEKYWVDELMAIQWGAKNQVDCRHLNTVVYVIVINLYCTISFTIKIKYSSTGSATSGCFCFSHLQITTSV